MPKRLLFVLLLAGILRAQNAPPASLGIFEGHIDLGTVLHQGSAVFDAASKSYKLSGSGENMWLARDDFQFVWKKVTGDLSLAATIELLGSGGDNHRKAVLMIRQSLDSDSPYADAALHGNGLTSLQFRETKGAPTHEIEATISGPKRLSIEKRGDRFYLFVSPDAGTPMSFAGGSAKVSLSPPFYVGIGVCAHNKDSVQQAAFTDVELKAGAPQTVERFSTVQTVAVASTDARVAFVTHDALDSPNWSPDGTAILFNNAGKLLQIPAEGGSPQPAEGDLPDSYGQERSPDGRYLYLSSTRSGTTQIWRTGADGSNAEQLTHDDQNNASPHLSPDGQQLLFLSYPSHDAVLVANTDVSLSVLTVADRKVRIVAKFTAGPGSISAHPWSPDGKRVTFISYQ
jgi:TolB protein